MCIYRSGISVIVITPDELQDLISAHDLTGMRREEMNDLNFLGSAGDILSVDLHGVVVHINLESVESEYGC